MTGKKDKIVKWTALAPLLLTFFSMGFADLVGIASNYAREEYLLSDSVTSLLPASLYVWFLLIAIPTGALLSHVGRRRTVVAGLVFLTLGMVPPLVADTFAALLTSFALIGIGATVLSVGLNPLMASIVPDNRLASSLTAGQTVKALSSICAPLVASLAASGAISLIVPGWRSVFAFCLAIAVPTTIWLALARIDESSSKDNISAQECGAAQKECKAGGIGASFALMKVPAVMAAFLAVVCHVGCDVSLNMMLPRFFELRSGATLDRAALATSLYFAARLAGSLAGIFVLRHIPIRKCLVSSLLFLTAGLAMLAFGRCGIVLCIATVLAGLGNSNICTLIISSAFLAQPAHRNEISGLTVAGLSGGAIFSMLCGLAVDHIGLTASLVPLAAATAFILLYAARHTR